MAVVIADPTSIRDWLEAAIERYVWYRYLDSGEAESRWAAINDLEGVFEKMRLRVEHV